MPWELSYIGRAEHFRWDAQPLMSAPGMDPEHPDYWNKVRALHDAQVSDARALVEQALRRRNGPVEVRVQGVLGIQERDESHDRGPGRDTLIISIHSNPAS